jgi:hypothetical protein
MCLLHTTTQDLAAPTENSQHDDLDKAVKRVQSLGPNLRIDAFFARQNTNQTVSFEAVSLQAAPTTAIAGPGLLSRHHLPASPCLPSLHDCHDRESRRLPTNRDVQFCEQAERMAAAGSSVAD